MYYDSLAAMKMRYERQKPCCRFQAETLLEYDQWKKSTRAKLRRLTGLNKMEPCGLNPRLIDRELLEGKSYTREKWVIQTEAHVWMPFYLLKPKESRFKKNPVIIAPHGHGSGGKAAVAGVWNRPDIREAALRQNYTYGTAMADQGFYVFCPDARGFGERREAGRQGEEPEQYMGCSCREISHMALGLGLTVTGLWVWDLMRLLDYIETRPDCDRDRIGCMGLSGGGMQTLWLSALDDRVSFAAVSGYFYGYKDSLLEMNTNCSCNYVPRLWEAVDMGDVGALIAPRPFVIESGTEDHLNGRRAMVNVLEQVETVRKAYGLFHSEHAFVHDMFEGKHQWCGKKVYPFARQSLLAGLLAPESGMEIGGRPMKTCGNGDIILD